MAIVNLSPPPMATRVKEESMAFEPLRPINEISEDGKTNSLKSPVKTKLCTTPHG